MKSFAAFGCGAPAGIAEGNTITTTPSVGWVSAIGLPLSTSRYAPGAQVGPTRHSPPLSSVTVSCVERPTRGLFFASFSKNDQPYSLRIASDQTPAPPLNA